MARRIIIGEILNLIKGLGGNPSKFMGTKSNINFLGKGPKEALFQGQIDVAGMMEAGYPIEGVIREAETAGGYAVANKLNDFQLQRLHENLIQLKKAYTPVPNITDLATGTRDLTQEGIASLREGERRFPAEARRFMGRPLKDADFVEIDRLVAEGKLPGAEGMGRGDVRKVGTYEFVDPTAEKLSYASRFNPRNEIQVEKAKALLEDPQIKGLYTEAEVKNAYDFDGLYQSHFDQGHVDVARLLEQEGHNIPQMRASARDALLQLMKKERGGSGLRDFVSEVDFKFISEGGGGRAGDPINLMVKYFGKNATENLPKNATKENIDVFTDFIVNSKDARGRGINDPFFDRESIDFSVIKGFSEDVPFKTGGRVGMRIGGLGLLTKGIRGALKRIKGAYDTPGANFAALMDDPSYLMSPVNMQKIKKLELYRQQLVRNILRKEGGGKFRHGPEPEATKADLKLLDEYIAELKKKIKEVGYYGEGAAPEKALLEASPDLPFPKFIRDKYRHADGGRTGFKYGSRTIAKGALAFLNKNKKNAEYMFKASDNVSPGYAHGDTKYNAELLAEQLAEDAGVVYHDLDDLARIEFYGTAYDYLAKEMGQVLSQKRMMTKLLGEVDESMTRQALHQWKPGKGRKPNASGGLAKILEV